MKFLLRTIMLIGILLVFVSGLCYSGSYFDDTFKKTKIFTNYQDSFGGAQFVEHCLKNGVNLVDEKTKVSLLHIAASKGWVEVAERLIDNGADVNLRGKNGETPLYVAVCDKQIDVVRYLITKDADVDLTVSFKSGLTHSSPLACAVNDGLFEIAKTLLLVKPDLNFYFDLGYSNEKDRLSVLGMAIRNRDFKMAELLVASDADLNRIGEDKGFQVNAIELAIRNEDIEMVDLLISAKVDINSAVTMGGIELTLLFYLLTRESSEIQIKILELLISRLGDADINKKLIIDGVEGTPLFAAVKMGNLKAVAMLIKAGADVNQIIRINKNKYSLLEIANTYKFPGMMQLLIDSGARKGLKAFILSDGKLDEIEL